MEMGIINDIISDINDQISFKGIPIISRTVSRTTLLKIQNMIELWSYLSVILLENI